MRRYIALAVLSLLWIPGCGGGGDGASPPPNTSPAAAMSAALAARLVTFMPMVANVEGNLVYVLNPGIAQAQGVSLVAAPSPANAFVFNGSYDADGDGLKETTMAGSIAFGADPAATWNGMSGQASIDVNIAGLMQLGHADLAYTITFGQRQISGSGRFTEPIGGTTTTLSVPAGAPLVIKTADNSGNAVSNACGYSISGQAQLSVVGSAGTLSSLWNFNPASQGVAVSGVSFTDSSGQATALPDTTVDLRCGGSGSISDWAAAFDQNWVCLPRESGQARLTLSVSGANTVTIVDEDPPGSGNTKTYNATIVGASAHAVSGFFIGGDPGNQYREDFTWTLRGDGSGFTQVSYYRYQQGANTGNGGICVASAKRVP